MHIVDAGLHVTFDIRSSHTAALSSLSCIHSFLLEVISITRMRALMPPYVFRYDGDGDAQEQGITGIVVIAESHISIHTYPMKNGAFLDVFSCRSFDHRSVLECVNATFEPVEVSSQTLNRSIPQGGSPGA